MVAATTTSASADSAAARSASGVCCLHPPGAFEDVVAMTGGQVQRREFAACLGPLECDGVEVTEPFADRGALSHLEGREQPRDRQ